MWFLFTVFMLCALVMVSLALWFSFQLAQPALTSDLHLIPHSPAMHVGSVDDPILEGDQGA